jgi:N-acetylglucosaminyl-diphospho-decaprenol L-rhamnosyltransferase
MQSYPDLQPEQLILSVVVVTYNSAADIVECIDSTLKDIEGLAAEVIVIDNLSSDHTVQLLNDKFAGIDRLQIIANTENLGFAGGNNQAAAMCKGKYLLMLNPDTYFEPGVFKELVDYLETNDRIGAIGPKLLYEDGSFQVSASKIRGPYLDSIIYHNLPWSIVSRLYQTEATKISDVDWILGACIMVRTDLFLEIGGLDLNYEFSGLDMADLCTLIRAKNFRTVYYPLVSIVHKGGTSHRSASPEQKAKALIKSHRGDIYYYQKNHGWFARFFILLVLITANAQKILVSGILGILSIEKYQVVCRSRLIVMRELLTILFSEPTFSK